MHLDYFENVNDFYPALKTLFEDLNIPVNDITEEPARPRDILTNNTFKENYPAFQLMDDVYSLGMVDDAAFEGNKSPDTSEIKSDYDGLLLFGVTLKERGNDLLPTRSQLAEITRAFNREFHYTPVVVVFRYNQYIAFANTERQKYKQEWREGEKAGKVSLLRDVKVNNPHTGHLKILQGLTITRTGRNAVNSFDELYKYWQEVFSVSLLNKKFYDELSKWYFWAVKEVTFPSNPTVEDEHLKKIDLATLRQEHNAKNIIRLLTRFLFVWFVKEKSLIPEELFDIDYLKDELLKDLSPVRHEGLFKEANIESVYYKAILQNLFFASLNCPIKPMEKGDNRERGFRLRDNFGQHRDANYLMRYKDQFKRPDKFVKLINDVVPFLNGGLFECLDNKTDKIYIDGFSDNLVKPHRLIVPDYLFFGFDQEVDLSGVIGIKTKEYEKARVKGLISILESYKFTIAENTPIEEDVALDPELLGKVFENLLASYNPETKTTARKQTGSFYTPREIVNYMVDESLIAYLKNSVTDWNIEADELDKQLHGLLSYDNINSFAENDDLQKQIIYSLDNCKVLDPACGSGAFPMGILQKMVHVLQKVDPENKYWQELQLNKAVKETEGAFTITDKKEREQKLIEINDAFDEKINDPDYARKLFLVENCIYGVDIQEIAAQISKLRFFISLIVDQKVDKSKENFGIRALPNLETKFVAANTLIGIDKPEAQGNLFESTEVKDLEQELKNVRHRLFSAKSPATKRRLRDKDKALREQISKLLIEGGLGNKTARQLASWDPYDQNASSPFFDPEWMFGIKDGFDIVIGNPPYIGERKNKHKFYNIQSSTSAKYYLGRMDYFYFFFHLGLDFLKSKGICTLITTNYFLTALGARKLRKDIQSRSSVLSVLNFNEAKVFDSAAGQHNMITILLKTNSDVHANISIVRSMGLLSSSELKSTLERRENSIQHYKLKQSELWDGEESYLRLSGKGSKDLPINYILDTLVNQSTDLLGNICSPLIGLESSLDKIYVASKDFFNEIIESNDELSHIKPFFKNSDISRYKLKKQTDRYILYLHEKILNINALKGIYKYLKRNESLIKGRKGANLRGAYKRDNWWVLNTPRLDMDFEDDKIVTPYRSKTLRFAFTKEPWYASRDVYYIVKKKTDISLKYILCLLNSKLYYIWLYNRGKRKGEMLELYAQPLKEIPIKEISKLEQEKFIFLANILCFAYLKLEKYSEVFEKITDAMVCELYFSDHMKEKEIDILEFVEQDLKETLGEDDFEQLPDEQKEAVIEELHKRWSNPASEIVKRMNSFAEKSPDILKPILESK